MKTSHTTDIKQMAEMWVMVNLGEMSQERFLQAFHARFVKEIQTVKNKRHKESNYGWDLIDWDKLSSSSVLTQLLQD